LSPAHRHQDKRLGSCGGTKSSALHKRPASAMYRKRALGTAAILRSQAHSRYGQLSGHFPVARPRNGNAQISTPVATARRQMGDTKSALGCLPLCEPEHFYWSVFCVPHLGGYQPEFIVIVCFSACHGKNPARRMPCLRTRMACIDMCQGFRPHAV